jgi:hypothetical protein
VHQRTGRPWGDEAFLEHLEGLTGRTLKRQKPALECTPGMRQ